MSISLLVTRGFGNGTLTGDVTKIAPSGYTNGPYIIEIPNVAWRITANRLQYRTTSKLTKRRVR